MKLLRALFAGALLVAASGAQAEDWPSRPITLIVPFSAGGGVDLSARIQAQRMGELLGQPIIVENVGAAAGMAGSARVAKADPDGYTILIGNSGTQAYSQALYKTPLYNSLTDFTPVGLVVDQTLLLLTRKDFPANDLQGFLTYARANQANLHYGSAGVGGSNHLACVLLNAAGGIVWATLYGGLAYLLGKEIDRLSRPAAFVFAAAALIVIIVGALLVRAREDRLVEAAEAALPGPLAGYPGGPPRWARSSRLVI